MKVTVGVGPSDAAVEVKKEPESGDEYGKYGLGYDKQPIQKYIMRPHYITIDEGECSHQPLLQNQ